MTTAVVDIGSDLVRKKWMREGLVQSASKSFWGAYTGTSKDAIVFQSNNENSGSGHTVVFDFDGNLSGKGIKGKDTAFGKGEQKKKFSDKLTVERYRLVADNGDKFDGVNIGDLSINEHSDSRNKLGDLFVRFKDQMLFDAASGVVNTESKQVQAPTHVIDLGTTFTFNQLLSISTTLKTSQGFTTGAIRAPLKPFMMDGDKPMWVMMIDASMANILRKDSNFQTIVYNADVRGNNNRLLSGVMGKIGNLMIVEAPQFFGATEGIVPGFGFNDSEVEIAGLRQYDGATPATAIWTGQTGFDYSSSNLHSRGFILGAGALQIAFGKQPDYKYKGSQDFDIKSESAVEFWTDACKTKLLAENKDYKAAKISGIDYGLIAVDVKVGS
jgi:N4-gp56 family major capsid protein